MKRIKLLVSVILFAALFNLLQAQPSPMLTDIHGNQIPFASLRGKWVLINYWASWCQPCLDEIQVLNRFYLSHRSDVALFAVNFDAVPIEEQLKLIQLLGIRYPSLMDDPGPQLGLESVRGVPATFVFNTRGRLTTTLYGGQTSRSLKRATGFK